MEGIDVSTTGLITLEQLKGNGSGQGLSFDCFLYTFEELKSAIILLLTDPNSGLINPAPAQPAPTQQPSSPLLGTLQKQSQPIEQHGLLSSLGITVDDFTGVLNKIADDYNAVPYHSFYHAFSVFHIVYLLLTQSPPIHELTLANPRKVFLLLFAALCHDVGHCGLTNAFYGKDGAITWAVTEDIPQCKLKLTDLPIIRPADKPALLENYHANRAAEFLPLLQTFTPEEIQFLKDCIMHTVMASPDPTIEELRKLTNLSDVDALFKILLHCGDISNPILPYPLFYKWTIYITTEFFNQGKQERRTMKDKLSKLPIPFPDKLTETQEREIQFKAIYNPFFANNIAKPLWDALFTKYDFDGILRNMDNNLSENIIKIKSCQMEIAAPIEKEIADIVPKDKIFCGKTTEPGDCVCQEGGSKDYYKKYMKYKKKYLQKRLANIKS